jgi:hypothetical protein
MRKVKNDSKQGLVCIEGKRERYLQIREEVRKET